MGKKHLFRIAAPKFWTLNKKEKKFVIRPIPGPHPIKKSIPLMLLVKNYLNYAKTSREAKKIIYSGKIEIDGVIRKEPAFPIGLMDIISIKEIKEHYRVLLGKRGKFILHKIGNEEASLKPLKIINKTLLKNKRIQLNFFDGKNKIVDKDGYKTSDTILYDTSKKSFADHLKLEKGSIVYLMDGKKMGNVGVVDSIKSFRSTEPTKIILTNGKNKFETLKDYAFVIGKEKLMISIPGENELSK